MEIYAACDFVLVEALVCAGAERLFSSQWGFEEGRQFGRGSSGGQVRDEYRVDFDVGRGGYGKFVAKQVSLHRAVRALYCD